MQLVVIILAPFAVFRFVMRVAVAFNAVFKITNAFTFMPAAYPGRCVFMAAIAAEFGKHIIGMAGHTTGIMVVIQQEELVVIKPKPVPSRGAVTVATSPVDTLVHIILRRSMTARTIITNTCLQQIMGKAVGIMTQACTRVIQVAGGALFLGQVLVEGYRCGGIGNGFARGHPQAYFGDRMTTGTPFR